MVDHCPNCEQSRNFVEIAKHETRPVTDVPCEYTFAKCDICGEPALFIREDYGEGFDHDVYWRMYPVVKTAGDQSKR